MAGNGLTPQIDREDILSTIRNLVSDRRTVVAVAGPPGSGKTTFADWLVNALNQGQSDQAIALYMDGFHLDNILLDKMGLLPRKGSPNTFDVDGLVHTLRRLRADKPEDVVVPVFDRNLEIARAGASVITKNVKCIVVEGNYLLSKEPPWHQLKPFFDLNVLIEVSRDILEKRLRERWEHFNLSEDEIQHKLYVNDLPNGDFVMATSTEIDLYYRQ